MWDFRKKLSIRKTAHNARNQRTVDLEATYIFTEGPNYSVGD
jgi:purine nucleoside phosphorylase